MRRFSMFVLIMGIVISFSGISNVYAVKEVDSRTGKQVGKLPDGSQQAESAKFVHPMAKRGFNPQPEPPGEPQQAESAKFTHPMAKRGFNPQPEPPGEPVDEIAAKSEKQAQY